MWRLYAILSALFASLTAILVKMGLKGIDSNLATAIRTIVVLIMAWVVVFITTGFSGGEGLQKQIANIDKKNLIFLILSGLATGFSWLFYFAAIQKGDVSKVTPIDKFSIVLTVILAFIILGEPIALKTIIAIILITLGTAILIF
jgi:transporter family protein